MDRSKRQLDTRDDAWPAEAYRLANPLTGLSTEEVIARVGLAAKVLAAREAGKRTSGQRKAVHDATNQPRKEITPMVWKGGQKSGIA